MQGYSLPISFTNGLSGQFYSVISPSIKEHQKLNKKYWRNNDEVACFE